MKPLSQSGFSVLLLVLAVLVVLVIVVFVAMQGFKAQPQFNVKTDNKNPFRQTQSEYVNPFRGLK